MFATIKTANILRAQNGDEFAAPMMENPVGFVVGEMATVRQRLPPGFHRSLPWNFKSPGSMHCPPCCGRHYRRLAEYGLRTEQKRLQPQELKSGGDEAEKVLFRMLDRKEKLKKATNFKYSEIEFKLCN